MNCQTWICVWDETVKQASTAWCSAEKPTASQGWKPFYTAFATLWPTPAPSAESQANTGFIDGPPVRFAVSLKFTARTLKNPWYWPLLCNWFSVEVCKNLGELNTPSDALARHSAARRQLCAFHIDTRNLFFEHSVKVGERQIHEHPWRCCEQDDGLSGLW